MNQRPLKELKGVPEQWKQYKDTNYYVSDQGRVAKHYKNGNKYECGWFDNKHNCNQMVAKVYGKDKRISNMVYETFVGKIPKGYGVAHKNGLKRDNSLYNLVLMTPKKLGKRTGHKATSQKVYCKDNNKIYRSARTVEKYLPISRQTVTDICNGIRKKPSMDLYWYDEENNKYYRGKYARTDVN